MADNESHMLTTVDNPFNPFTQWDEWYEYDTSHGYYSAQYLARIVRTSDELSDEQQDEAREQAIDEIVNNFDVGLYTKASSLDT